MKAGDPIAEALRPAFERAAAEALACIADGSTGTFAVLRGLLPTAEITIVGGTIVGGGSDSVISTHIASVMGKLGDPDSVLTHMGAKTRVPGNEKRVEEMISSFGREGPGIAANTVRWIFLALNQAGIPFELQSETALEMAVAAVMES